MHPATLQPGHAVRQKSVVNAPIFRFVENDGAGRYYFACDAYVGLMGADDHGHVCVTARQLTRGFERVPGEDR